jgi:hypothetical protein
MPTARAIFVLLYIAAAVAVWLALPIQIAAALLVVNAVAAAVFGFSYLFNPRD